MKDSAAEQRAEADRCVKSARSSRTSAWLFPLLFFLNSIALSVLTAKWMYHGNWFIGAATAVISSIMIYEMRYASAFWTKNANDWMKLRQERLDLATLYEKEEW